MSLLLWALLLLLAGCAFLALEFFVPSSGTLGVLAALSFVAAIVLAFMAGPVYGTVTFLAVLAIVPTACFLAVKYWPETPIGRMMLIQSPANPDEVLPETEAYRGMQHLVGKHGIAKSLMMPGGVVEIDRKSYDAVERLHGHRAGNPRPRRQHLHPADRRPPRRQHPHRALRRRAARGPGSFR